MKSKKRLAWLPAISHGSRERMLQYHGGFIYPPRPGGGTLWDSELAKRLESDSEYLAQAKLNGSNCLLEILLDGSFLVHNRHGNLVGPKLWPDQMELVRFLLPRAPALINFEFIRRPDWGFEDVWYIWDLMAIDGKYLIGSTVSERREVLQQSLPEFKPSMYSFAKAVGRGILVASDLTGNWRASLRKYHGKPWFEGVVAKRTSGRLDPGVTSENNHHWSTRILTSNSPGLTRKVPGGAA